nr:polyprotein [Picornaviridae sp.]
MPFTQCNKMEDTTEKQITTQDNPTPRMGEQRRDENLQNMQTASARRNVIYDALNREEKKIVDRFVAQKKFPTSKRSTQTRKMVSRKGTEFEVYGDDNSFYSGNDKQPEDAFIEVLSLTDNDERNHVVFTYGQMEGARKLMWRHFKPQYDELRRQRRKTKYIRNGYSAPMAYRLLRSIQQELNGQAEEDRQFYATLEKKLEEEDSRVSEMIEEIVEAQAHEYFHSVMEIQPPTRLVMHETLPQQAVIEDIKEEEAAPTAPPVEEQYEFYNPAAPESSTCINLPMAHSATIHDSAEYIKDHHIFDQGWRKYSYGQEFDFHKGTVSGMQPSYQYAVLRRQFSNKQRRMMMKNNTTPAVPQMRAEADVQNDVSKEENTTFTDQRSTVMDDGYINSQIEPNMQAVSMQENQWHVRDIMKKPIPFYHGDWTTSNTQGEILKQWDIPGDTLLGPHYNQVATFVFWRGHPTVRFQINGTKFHNGRLIAAFIPAFQFTQYDEVLYDTDTLTSLPHVILDAGFSNSGVINLPFVHMNTYFNTVQGSRGWQSLGRLVLVVFNRLGSATTSSQSIGVTAWVSYDNCELHQPCYAHTVNLPKAGKRFLTDTPRAQAAVEGLLKSVAPMITDLVAPGMGSLVGNVLGGVADCDKPTDPQEISRWVPNAVTSLSMGSGLDKSSRLSLENSSYTLGDADLISTTTDDMNLLEICKIPTRLVTLKFSSQLNTGSRLFKIPVCPNLYSTLTSSAAVTPPVDILTPTLLAYCARGFKFWRGGIRVKIQLIASQMHSARALIAYGPGLTDMQFDGATYINTYVIDLQERHEVEFVVPYLAERPWMRCDRLRQLDESGMTEASHDNFENTGYLYMYVLNRLSKPDSVSAEIDINVLVSAADDFELAVPADFACAQGIGNVVNAAPVAQALVGQQDVSERTEEGIVSLTKGGGRLGSVATSTLSENAMNLKTLLRRYYKVYQNKFTIPSETSTISFANSPTLSSVNKCFNSKRGIQYRTHLSHFSELFTFWRGSLRYKLVWTLTDDTNFPALSIRVFHIPGAFIFGNFTAAVSDDNTTAVVSACEAYGTLLGQSNVQSSLEFEVPFYTPYTQLRTIQGAQPNARSCTGLVLFILDKPAGGGNANVHLDLYQSAGDDFGLNYLRAAPRLQFVRGAEQARNVSDIAPFIYNKIPDICPRPTSTESLAFNETQTEAKAQALVDYIPIVGDHIKATRSMAGAADSVSGVCDTARHLMQQAATKVGLTSSEDDDETDEPTIIQTVTNTASALSDPIITIFTTLSEYLQTLPHALGVDTTYDMYTTALDIATLITAFRAYQDSNVTLKTLALITIVTTLFGTLGTLAKNLLYRFASSVVSNLYGSKQGNQLPTAESDVFDFIAPLTATLSIAVGMLGFKSIPSDRETTDIVKGISEKLRLFNFSSLALNNVKALWLQLKDIFEWITDKVCEYWNPEYLAQMKLKREFSEVEEWAHFIDELENINYEDKIHYDPEFRRKVYRAVDIGKRYNALLITGKFGREANVVREYVRRSLEICTKCDKSKNTLPFRKDPFCITMYGKTGVGKSGIITELGFTLLDQLEYPRHNRWCAINCSDKFFNENYTQQSAVYFDDFSTFTSEEQYQTFFNLKANTAFPLNMAFKKGEYFNSDFIFMTTNTSHPNPNCLTCIPALWRRRDILIEADFIEELQERGMAGEYVMREDNSHARYRLANPRKEGEYLTDWMDYAALVAELMVFADEHRQRQEKKLKKDLTRAGYIVPQAEAGKMRKVCVEACKNSPSLMVFSPEIWDWIVYDLEMEMFKLSPDAPLEVTTDYMEMQDTLEALGLPADEFQTRMRQNSYEVKEKTSLMTKIKGSLSALKTLVGSTFDKLKSLVPAIATLGRCAFTLAVTFFAWKTILGFTGAVVHTCLCFGIRRLGYRCGICGKWPLMKQAADPQFLMNEWRSLYGDMPYEDGYVTTCTEEWTIRAVQTGEKKIAGVWIGTQKKAEAGPYSDNTNGARVVKVMANGTYQTETKGAPAQKILAHAQDKHVTDLINNRVLQCQYRIRFNGSATTPPISMQAFAIGGRHLVTMAHFFQYIKEGEYWEIFHSNQWMEIEYNESKATKLEKKDLMVYEMPIQFHLHKSNIGHFISERELAFARKFPVTMVQINSNLQNVLKETVVEPQEELKYVYEVAGESTPIKVQHGWKYRLQTAPGDCGAPLLAHCTKLQGRILGFHVCGNGTHGWATLITKEMLEKFVTVQDGSCLPPAQAKIGNLIPPGHFGRIGKSDKIFFQNDATQIVKTDIHGEISKPVTFPAVLSRNDERLDRRVNPLQIGIGKYSKSLRPFPLRHREMVNDFMHSELHTFTRLRRPALLTTIEMVRGIPEFEQAFEALPMNTSPGWPYINTRPRGECGKAYLFDINGQIVDSELQRRLQEREERARRGERVESIWIDCMKDERRALEKIKSGSTRIFTIGPVDFSLLCRKYCQDFVEAIKASRGFSHCKLGIDPQSLEWTELYNYLRSFADCMVAGDFTRFDGTVHPELIEDYFDDVDYFYKEFGCWSPEDSKVRRVLADEVVNTIQLAKDEFYMTHGGNPSGNQQTTPLNSRTNFRYMALAWIGITEQRQDLHKYHSMHSFSKNVRVACYGDDNILAIKREVIEWFNQESISGYLEKYGIVYTNETKDGITKWKALDECTFLKQGFRNHETITGIKAPVMKESTLLELLNWTRIAPDQDQLLEDNCLDSLRFAYFYGEEYFNNLRRKINDALTKHGKNFRLMTFLDYHYWFLGTIGMIGTKSFRSQSNETNVSNQTPPQT